MTDTPINLFLVEYSGICEIESQDAASAELEFEKKADHLMGAGTVSYHRPLTEDEYEQREAERGILATTHQSALDRIAEQDKRIAELKGALTLIRDEARAMSSVSGLANAGFVGLCADIYTDWHLSPNTTDPMKGIQEMGQKWEASTEGGGVMEAKSCSTCAFNGLMSGNCYFPKPQDGTDGPMFAPSSMPDVDGDGENCHHWRRHEKR